jgi:hypothetical protein
MQFAKAAETMTLRGLEDSPRLAADDDKGKGAYAGM